MIKVTDHKGMEWPSVALMLEHYGLTRSIFRRRIMQGWSMERTLTEPAREYQHHKDGAELSLGARIKAAGLSRYAHGIYKLVRLGFTPEDAMLYYVEKLEGRHDA